MQLTGGGVPGDASATVLLQNLASESSVQSSEWARSHSDNAPVVFLASILHVKSNCLSSFTRQEGKLVVAKTHWTQQKKGSSYAYICVTLLFTFYFRLFCAPAAVLFRT